MPRKAADFVILKADPGSGLNPLTGERLRQELFDQAGEALKERGARMLRFTLIENEFEGMNIAHGSGYPFGLYIEGWRESGLEDGMERLPFGESETADGPACPPKDMVPS